MLWHYSFPFKCNHFDVDFVADITIHQKKRKCTFCGIRVSVKSKSIAISSNPTYILPALYAHLIKVIAWKEQGSWTTVTLPHILLWVVTLDGHRSLSAGYLMAFQSESSNKLKCVVYSGLHDDWCSLWVWGNRNDRKTIPSEQAILTRF